MGKTIAIIGAGPSGLTTAKAAIECGLTPIIFEKSSSVGGVWNQSTGSVWLSLLTNISKFTCSFSDFPWPENAPMFPNQKDVFKYLEGYTQHFNLNKHIQFKSTIKKIQKTGNTWQINWTNNEEELKFESVDYVVIATGIFSQPTIPNFTGLDTFKGEIIHSHYYKSPDKFKDKKVVVVGSAFSGVEIAADFAAHNQVVVNEFRKPYWIIPREIPLDPSKKSPVLPLDLVFYTRASVNKSSTSVEEANIKKNTYFSKLCPNQNNKDSDLYIASDSKDTVRVAISDNYCEAVNSKNIITKKSSDISFLDNGIKLTNGEIVPTDVVIFCTGYQLDLPFFDNDILSILDFKKDDQLQPMLLYKATLHPDLENIAFVGMYRGPYFGVIELQARWACMLFSNKISYPTKELMVKGIELEKAIRNQVPRPQFPHGDYVEFADGIAKDINVLPNFDKIKLTDHLLYDRLWNKPLIPAHYRLEGLGNNPKVALPQIEQLSNYLESKIQSDKNKLPAASTLLQNVSGTSGIFSSVAAAAPKQPQASDVEKLEPTTPNPM